MKYSDTIAKIEKALADGGIDLRKIEDASTVDFDGKDMAVISLQVVMPLSEAVSA
ncbi:MAG: hypothetical protein AB1499_13865 [Nitrospirota bacterium]